MTYPPQGGYPDPNSPFGAPSGDPYGWQDPNAGNGRGANESDTPAYPDDSSVAGQQYQFDGYSNQQPGYQPSMPQSGIPASPAPQYPQTPWQPQPPQQQPNYGPPQGGYPNQGYMAPVPPPKSSNTGMFVGIGVGALVLVALVAVLVIVLNAGGANDKNNTGGNNGTDGQVATPEEVVDDYYQALAQHNVDGILATLCEAEVTNYNNAPLSDEELKTQLWDIADDSTYAITETVGADTDKPKVKVDITYKGTTSVAIAVLTMEDGAWKICNWEYE